MSMLEDQVFAELPEGDMWYSEYHAPDVKLSFKAEVLASDGIHGAPSGLSAIISNPPFHSGVHTSYAASETLLREAARHLQPGGELRIVANSFLRYSPLIEEHLGTCQTLAEAEGFRIYRARRR